MVGGTRNLVQGNYIGTDITGTVALSKIGDPQGMLLTPQQRTERAGRLLASAVALTLLGKGWQLENQPGQFYLLRDREKLNVFALVDELVAGKLSGEVWVKRCNELGINGAPLYSGVANPAPSPN